MCSQKTPLKTDAATTEKSFPAASNEATVDNVLVLDTQCVPRIDWLGESAVSEHRAKTLLEVPNGYCHRLNVKRLEELQPRRFLVYTVAIIFPHTHMHGTP
ncbi:MAG: hypothetical protein GY820_31080 [Gammaproteobacteria bacterium]|nr:hypothetical protein [Gammaproteobacteria bacterium]